MQEKPPVHMRDVRTTTTRTPASEAPSTEEPSSDSPTGHVKELCTGMLSGVGGHKSPVRIAGFVAAVMAVGLATSTIYDLLSPDVAYSARVDLEGYAQEYAAIVAQGVDPRDIESYLERLQDVPADEREDEVEQLYKEKQIELPLKEALVVVLRNMEQQARHGVREIQTFTDDGNDQIASALASINEVFVDGSADMVLRESDIVTRSMEDAEKQVVYMYVAEQFEAMYQLDDAEEYYRKVEEMRRKEGTETRGYAEVLGALGNIFYARGEYERAYIYFGKGFEAADEAGDSALKSQLKAGRKLAQGEIDGKPEYVGTLMAKLGNSTDGARWTALKNSTQDIPPRLTGEEAAQILRHFDPDSRYHNYAIGTIAPFVQNPLPAEDLLLILGRTLDDNRQHAISELKEYINAPALSAGEVEDILKGIDPNSRHHGYALDALK